eukprot:TRINITY_DN813_c0_g2_i1.p1 TRINITY_DN813_c0_g2~~TRINITY_DN813_c0_g2_i1.p1  ORF type:complete len:403 (+),score=74.98 TRINITY_DN813_c0_g2_i1:117-1325(+)
MLKGTKRTLQRFKNKTGIGHETVDAQFDAHQERYKASLTLLEKIKEHMSKVVEAHRTLNVAAMEMSKTLSKLAERDEDNFEAFNMHRDALIEIDLRWRDMDAVVVAEAMLPTARFTGEFLIVQERIDLRHTRRLDAERYAAGLSGKSKKDQATYNRARQKAEGAKAAFEALNEELKRDVPRACNHLSGHFSSSFATFIRQQSVYLGESGKQLTAVRERLGRVDPRAAQARPRVITATAASEAAKSAVTEAKMTDVEDDTEVHRVEVKRDLPVPAKKEAPAPVKREAPAPVARAVPAPVKREMPVPVKKAETNPFNKPTPTPTPTPAAAAAPAAATNPFKKQPEKPKGKQAKALWDFAGTDEDELPFKKGDIVTVTNTDDGDWWEAEMGGKSGTIPSNYVKML